MDGMTTPSARAAATLKMSTGRDPGALKALRSNTCAACAKAQDPSQRSSTCLNHMSGQMSCQPALIVPEQCESSTGGTASVQPDAAAITAGQCRPGCIVLKAPAYTAVYDRCDFVGLHVFLWCSTC